MGTGMHGCPAAGCVHAEQGDAARDGGSSGRRRSMDGISSARRPPKLSEFTCPTRPVRREPLRLASGGGRAPSTMSSKNDAPRACECMSATRAAPRWTVARVIGGPAGRTRAGDCVVARVAIGVARTGRRRAPISPRVGVGGQARPDEASRQTLLVEPGGSYFLMRGGGALIPTRWRGLEALRVAQHRADGVRALHAAFGGDALPFEKEPQEIARLRPARSRRGGV